MDSKSVTHFFTAPRLSPRILRSRILSLGIFSLAVVSLSACKNYSLSINDNVVYTPPALFTQFNIADQNLRTCVEQTIADKHISKAEDLKQLNCSNAGITSLGGLEIFTAIEQLNLSENALSSASQLSHLTRLSQLSLRKNNLTSAEPLLHLLHLRVLDIAENKNLGCGDLRQLLSNFHKGELTVTLPEQCNKAG